MQPAKQRGVRSGRGLIHDIRPGFPERLKNLENENDHGKVMQHATFAKSH